MPRVQYNVAYVYNKEEELILLSSDTNEISLRIVLAPNF